MPYYERYVITERVTTVHVPVECNRTHLSSHPSDAKALPLPPSPPPQPKLSSEARLKQYLAQSDFIIYPEKLTLIGLKHERLLEVWGQHGTRWHLIHAYPFTGFSGRLGPKLREGDRQIPEGIYKITYLNPNSKFHLSLRVNYPNAFDRRVAQQDQRTGLGSDIMIHGSHVTTGCIPIGNDNIEELYFLAEKVGMQNIKVILSPVDFRVRDVAIGNDRYPWLGELYSNIAQELKPFTSK
ncbi:MAG TPA: hypothetical protein ENK86_05000 [Campylobacterales bacterium]|nr:hypothetical protein [Campylobacterales bacterium]